LGSDDPNKTPEENAREKEEIHKLFMEKAQKNAPLGRTSTPEDIANAVLFLVSDESAYITGITLDVTGGEYIYNC
jgi:NAD(P)-dependent dehydrogenase (short-subunit alcohol dehydrogenase family)